MPPSMNSDCVKIQKRCISMGVQRPRQGLKGGTRQSRYSFGRRASEFRVLSRTRLFLLGLGHEMSLILTFVPNQTCRPVYVLVGRVAIDNPGMPYSSKLFSVFTVHACQGPLVTRTTREYVLSMRTTKVLGAKDNSSHAKAKKKTVDHCQKRAQCSIRFTASVLPLDL